MQYFLQQSCSFWFLWNGSRQLLAEGLHHVAGDVLRGWLHKQSCLQKLVFHLPQNPGCHPVKGQSQWRAGVHHWQDACCHLYRRKPSQDKLKSATAKVYHLKANQTNLICGSSTALFLQRWKSKAMLLFFFSLGAHFCHCLSFLEKPAQLSSAEQAEAVCQSHRRLQNPTRRILAGLASLGCWRQASRATPRDQAQDKLRGAVLIWRGNQPSPYRLTLSGWCPCVSFPLQVRTHQNDPCN